MTKKDVLAHFGGVCLTAKALCRSHGAVSKWPERLKEDIKCWIVGYCVRNGIDYPKSWNKKNNDAV